MLNQKALAAAVSTVPVYIEDTFSTYVYEGSGTSKTITNNIDLLGYGGLVWTKMRSSPLSNEHNHRFSDSGIGITEVLSSNNTDPKTSSSNFGITSFNAAGYTITNPSSSGGWNYSGDFFVSWTFRKQPKFFDVVTYTGNGTAGRTVSHSLGSVPGCIIVKRTDAANGWAVYHRSMNASPQDYMMRLNATDAAFTTSPSRWNNTLPTSTEFTLSGNDEVNGSGGTYVAYLFAHDAGGFGTSGSDNVISCGSFSGGGATVNLGWEPQWILAKRTDTTGNWYIDDNMRGWPAVGSNDNPLLANSSSAEPTGYAGFAHITSTGFTNNFNGDYIYIAIRRGPMKTPTSGTSVFSPVLATVADGTGAKLTTSFPIDLQVMNYTPGTSSNSGFLDRLRGIATTTTESGQRLISSATSAEATASVTRKWDNTGFEVSSAFNNTRTIYWNFRRAPGFFDVVCYTGTGPTSQAVTHNLGVQPTLIIVKCRSLAGQEWAVQINGDGTKLLKLNSTAAIATNNAYWNDTNPTSTTFTVGPNSGLTNSSGATYVAYLFATLAGVSKVGSYTGNGSNQTIDCGFTAGARFVMIKRTDSTGDWYVWNSATGIVAGNDPHLSLNTTAAEVTTDDSVDTDNSGFIVNQLAATNINVSSATYIFLSVA